MNTITLKGSLIGLAFFTLTPLHGSLSHLSRVSLQAMPVAATALRASSVAGTQMFCANPAYKASSLRTYSSRPSDPYTILGISRNATPADIKAAHKKLVFKYHPDVNPSPQAKAQFQEVQKAYETLKNAPTQEKTTYQRTETPQEKAAPKKEAPKYKHAPHADTLTEAQRNSRKKIENYLKMFTYKNCTGRVFSAFLNVTSGKGMFESNPYHLTTFSPSHGDTAYNFNIQYASKQNYAHAGNVLNVCENILSSPYGFYITEAFNDELWELEELQPYAHLRATFSAVHLALTDIAKHMELYYSSRIATSFSEYKGVEQREKLLDTLLSELAKFDQDSLKKQSVVWNLLAIHNHGTIKTNKNIQAACQILLAEFARSFRRKAH